MGRKRPSLVGNVCGLSCWVFVIFDRFVVSGMVSWCSPATLGGGPFALAPIFLGSLAAFFSALNAASMTLFVASFVTVSRAFSLVKTTSSSIQIIALFHAVAISLRTLSKVSAMRRRFSLSSSSNFMLGGLRVWLIWGGSSGMALLCSLDSIVVLASWSPGLGPFHFLAVGGSLDSLSYSKVV